MRLLIVFLICGSTVLASSPQEVHVDVGAPFSVEIQTSIPEEAYPALRTHGEVLAASGPLPWPCTIERVEVCDGKITLSARMLRPGVYEVPLGVLSWGEKTYVLPSFTCSVAPIHFPKISVADMLLPFPEVSLQKTQPNLQQQQVLLDENQMIGMERVQWQTSLRHGLYIACLFLMCAPFALQCWRWWRMKVLPVEVALVVTPDLVLQQVKALRQDGEVSWPKLMYALNLVASSAMPSLTSYELQRRFAQRGDQKLEKASAYIELYGYCPESSGYFDQAVHLVEEGIHAAKNSSLLSN